MDCSPLLKLLRVHARAQKQTARVTFVEQQISIHVSVGGEFKIENHHPLRGCRRMWHLYSQLRVQPPPRRFVQVFYNGRHCRGIPGGEKRADHISLSKPFTHPCLKCVRGRTDGVLRHHRNRTNGGSTTFFNSSESIEYWMEAIAVQERRRRGTNAPKTNTLIDCDGTMPIVRRPDINQSARTDCSVTRRTESGEKATYIRKRISKYRTRVPEYCNSTTTNTREGRCEAVLWLR